VPHTPFLPMIGYFALHVRLSIILNVGDGLKGPAASIFSFSLSFKQSFDTTVHMEPAAASKDLDTRKRLLLTAEELFADRGFHGVGVREITSAAGVHLSAVNYHFGSKDDLYLGVFKELFIARARQVRNHFLARLAKASPSARSVIRAFAEAVLFGPMDDRERSVHYRLLAREMTEPTEAFKLISRHAVQPLIELLTERLSSCFPRLSPEELSFAAMSLFAQIIYFNFARAKVTAITGRQYDRHFKERLVNHIVEFSLKGLEGLNAR